MLHSIPFSFYSRHLPSHFHFGFFFHLFVGVFRPNQQFLLLCYASVHLLPCYAVYLLPGHCYCLLVVFLH
jgi:hypothetical protein